MDAESSVEIGDLAEIARRRGKLVGIITLIAVSTAYIVAMALPNEYESYSTVLVEPQSVDPELVRSAQKETDLAGRLHLMTAQILSRGRLSRVIDDLGLYDEEAQYMVRDEIIDMMKDRITVEPVIPELVQALEATRQTDFEINTFRIYVHDDKADIAREIAQRIGNDFIQTHIEARVNVSQKSVDFIDSELERLSDQIIEVEAKIAEVKEDNPGRLPEDMPASQRSLERVMGDLRVAQRRLAEAESDVIFFNSQADAEFAGGAGDTSPTQRIQLLELALAEFEAKGYTPKHPDVVKTTSEIEEIRKQVTSDDDDDSEPDPLTSVAQQRAQAEAQRSELRKLAIQDEVDRLEANAEEVQTLLFETPAVAEQLDGLEREYQHLFESYQDFSNRRLEAMVQAQLERRQLGEQFRVLESAFEALEPTSPNRPMIILLGLLFGVTLGVGLAVVLESVDTSVHNARQLQSALQLPVLASIPQIWLESDVAARRRGRIRAALATSVVMIFVLASGVGSYLWVNGGSSDLSEEEEGSTETEDAVETSAVTGGSGS